MKCVNITHIPHVNRTHVRRQLCINCGTCRTITACVNFTDISLPLVTWVKIMKIGWNYSDMSGHVRSALDFIREWKYPR